MGYLPILIILIILRKRKDGGTQHIISWAPVYLVPLYNSTNLGANVVEAWRARSSKSSKSTPVRLTKYHHITDLKNKHSIQISECWYGLHSTSLRFVLFYIV